MVQITSSNFVNPLTSDVESGFDGLLSHGDRFRIVNPLFTLKTINKTFLGGHGNAIESTAIGAMPADGNGWLFSTHEALTAQIVNDPVRGKVFKFTEDATKFNAALRYNLGSLGENTKFYAAHRAKLNLTLSGVPYTYGSQVKHFRLSSANDVNDSLGNGAANDTQLKYHLLYGPTGLTGYNELMYTNGTSSGDTVTSAVNSTAPKRNNQWHLIEAFVNTGTESGSNGYLLVRITNEDTGTVVTHRLSNIPYYTSAHRYAWYIEQYYQGTFNQRVQNMTYSAVNVLNSTTYNMRVENRVTNAVVVGTYTSDASATLSEILTGLAADLASKLPLFTVTNTGTSITVNLTTTDFTSNYYSTTTVGNATVTNTVLATPSPDGREIWRDDQYLSIGDAAWTRVELRQFQDEALFGHRELQDLDEWGAGFADGRLNTGGIPVGVHDLKLCFIDGVDSNGKDQIVLAYDVQIEVKAA